MIDKFIKNKPTIEADKRIDEGLKYNDLIKSSTEEDKSFFATDLLADIYAKQGYDTKAIKMYGELILIHPEKEEYYNKKIEKLKEKIENDKN